jgi:hypothetical protein
VSKWRGFAHSILWIFMGLSTKAVLDKRRGRDPGSLGGVTGVEKIF